MNCKAFYISRDKAYGVIIVLLLSHFWFGQPVNAADAFQIKGYYLGATPEELGVTVDIDPDEQAQSLEAIGTGNVSIFFVRVGEQLRAHRIIKEEVVNKEDMQSTLKKLKEQYGIPEMQHIEASYIKKSPKIMKYELISSNRALWNITESQEFIAWIEQGRIVYELLDHDPSNVKVRSKPSSTDEDEPKGDEPGGDGWETDF
jgi:hypothetical protein